MKCQKSNLANCFFCGMIKHGIFYKNMNTKYLEKILSPWFFVALNILIILWVELTGTFFYNTGLLHAIALFFVVLAVVRIFVHYRTYDQFLDKIKYASIAALFIFAASHIVEYINLIVYYRYDDAVFATTINFYLIGLSSIAIGAELFLVKHDHRPNTMVWFLYVIAIALAGLNLAIAFNHELISLEPDSVFPYAYFVLAVILLTIGITKIVLIKRKISISIDFLNYLIGSLCLLAVAMVPNIFYETLEMTFGVPMYRIMYISHFAFFMSVSLMFLSYEKLSNLTGIYAEVEKTINNKTV